MRMLCVLVMVLAPVPAFAQVMLTTNDGPARACYIQAKTGSNPRDGVEVCSHALRDQVLSIRDRAATYDNRGIMLDALGRHDEAVDDYVTSIRLDGTLGDPHVNLGSGMIRRKRFPEALAEIKTGMDLGLSFPHIGYYDRAVAEELTGRYREAYYDFKKALELEPNFTLAAERLKDFTVTKAPASPS